MTLRPLIDALIAVTAIAGAVASSPAAAQYYGGVVLNSGPKSTEFGFNGGARPSEIVDLNQLSRGLSLSKEPSIGMKLGYRFNPYFSVEGRYSEKSAFRTDDVFQRDVDTIRAKSMGLDLVGSLPVFQKLSVEGRVGFRVGSNGTESLASTPYTALNGSRAINTGALGVGLQYNFNSSLGLRFEVERSRKFIGERGISDAENVLLGVYWRF